MGSSCFQRRFLLSFSIRLENMEKYQYKKLLLQTIKIAFGSSLSIVIAEKLNLQFAASAGIITLLTIVTTKWETLKLSGIRLLSFGVSMVLAYILGQTIKVEWFAFGIYIFAVVIICNLLEWQATISVNAVIGTHLLTGNDFSPRAIENELALVMIGITIAIILNLFHVNSSQKQKIIENMRFTEDALRKILGELAAYLNGQEMSVNVWDDIISLEAKLHDFVDMAYEYQDNTFHSHPEYYIDYFEMRTKQFNVLHNLHYEMKKIRNIPQQAKRIEEFILYIREGITEINNPLEEIKRLEEIFTHMRQEPLPQTREEFESRAILYHILMDLDEFLIFKKRFVEKLSEEQKKRYWGK